MGKTNHLFIDRFDQCFVAFVMDRRVQILSNVI